MTASAPTLLLGSQVPTSSHSPAGVVSHAPAEAAIRQAAAAGLELDEWQKFVLRNALGVRADGKWAAFSSCLLVPRQNGKGSVLEALALAALFQFDTELTVWTAHQMKTAKEGFRRLVAHISATPDLMRQVAAIRRGNDDRGIELVDGRRCQFIAREGGAGVGFTADLVIFDEAWKLDAETIANVIPTLSAVPNPQVWYTSSAPHAESAQLHAMRRRAGTDPRLAFAEWCADVDDDPRSEATWAKTNPGYGIRIERESIEAEWQEFDADANPTRFARERLGVPEPEPLNVELGAVDPAVWESLAQVSTISDARQWALAVSRDREWAALGVAGRRDDGRVHVEWMDHRSGTGWIVDRIVEGWKARQIPIRIHRDAPEGSFIDPLRHLGVQVVEVTTADVAKATGQFLDAVKNRTLVHIGQPTLSRQVRGAQVDTSKNGAAIWVDGGRDITTLKAVTVALGGVAVEHAPLVFAY